MPVLDYDFDVVPQRKMASGDDPLASRLTSYASRAGDQGGVRELRFRSARTAEALSKAPEPLREVFAVAGFRYGDYASGAPAGTYPACDAATREKALGVLVFGLKQLKSRKTGRSGFDLNAFLEAAHAAQPVEHTPEAYMAEPVGPARMADGSEIIGGPKKPVDAEEVAFEAEMHRKRKRFLVAAVAFTGVVGIGAALLFTVGDDPAVWQTVDAVMTNMAGKPEQPAQ
ncbi:MAG: hypothetical protein AAFT19_03815 [Pseudomonadota bacterium]